MRLVLSGVELHGFHGRVTGRARARERFLVDVRLEPLSAHAAATDDIRDAVDYRDVVSVVQQVSVGHAFYLLEAFAAAISDALLERLPLAWVEVTVRKPDVRLAVPVEHAAVTVERYAVTESE